MQAEEGNNITLRCELSKPGVPVEWKKGEELLKNGVKFQIKTRETTLELLLWKPLPEDSGVYSCVCANQKTMATVNITGRRKYFSLTIHAGKNKFSYCIYVCAYYSNYSICFPMLPQPSRSRSNRS